MRQTLLLDASFYPIQMIDWKKALTLQFTDRAEIVEHHHDIEINSTHESFKLPKVMRLFCKVTKTVGVVKFNRLNVFYRDNFTCQYCGNHFKKKDLTLDHVYPKSKGGKTDWTNIVTACGPCNTKKADKLLENIEMKLLNKPFGPRWMSMFLIKLGHKERSVWKDWFY